MTISSEVITNRGTLTPNFSFRTIWGDLICAGALPNSVCWLGSCDSCSNGQKLIPRKATTEILEYSQWKEVWVAKKKKKDADDDESDNEDEGYIFTIVFE